MNIGPSLSTLPGVAQVTVFGQKKYAVRVDVDPKKLAARNLTMDELAKAIDAANGNSPHSSRNSVPPSARSNHPLRTFTAPVKLPFS